MGTQSEFPGVLASLRDEFSSYAKVGGGTALSAKAGKEGLITAHLFFCKKYVQFLPGKGKGKSKGKGKAKALGSGSGSGKGKTKGKSGSGGGEVSGKDGLDLAGIELFERVDKASGIRNRFSFELLCAKEKSSMT